MEPNHVHLIAFAVSCDAQQIIHTLEPRFTGHIMRDVGDFILGEYRALPHALRWIRRVLILNYFDENFVTRVKVPAQPRPVLIFVTRLRDEGA